MAVGSRQVPVAADEAMAALTCAVDGLQPAKKKYARFVEKQQQTHPKGEEKGSYSTNNKM
jgi:hypothetical protein